MATSKTKPSTERTPTYLTVARDRFKDQVSRRIELGELMLRSDVQSLSQLVAAKREYSDWNDYNSELLKQSFNHEDNEYKHDYDRVNLRIRTIKDGGIKELKGLRTRVHNKITNLKQLLAKVDLIKAQFPDKVIEVLAATPDISIGSDVFIVHGHNVEIKVSVARTLEKLGLNPVILHEQANTGKTIIEKFEKHSKVGFAIILLTDDDLGKSKKEEDLRQRARQNVILELGYFIGKLGRNRVCALHANGVELPSDLHGLAYVPIDAGESWKFKMAKELKAAGYDVDMNRII